MTSVESDHGIQCLPYSAKFSMALQTEILSTENRNFRFFYIFILNSINFALYIFSKILFVCKDQIVQLDRLIACSYTDRNLLVFGAASEDDEKLCA